MNPLVGGGDEAFEEGVGLVGFAVEFRMELAGDEEGVFWNFDNFDEFAIGRIAAEAEAGFFELVAVGVVEFVAMTVAFVYDESAIKTRGFGPHDKLARLRAEAHRAAFLCDAGLLIEHRDNWMRRIAIEFS